MAPATEVTLAISPGGALHGCGICVPTPEYCTVFSALLAFSRISRLRVSPNEIVRESEPLSDTVPGNWMELRDALP